MSASPVPQMPGRPAYLIDGKRYPLVAIDTASLWDIIEIKEQTGLTVATLERCLTDISGVGEPDSMFATESDVFSSGEHLMALGVQMWLARRAAGEHLTIREASSVPIGQWQIVADEVEAEPEDPTGAADAVAATAPD